MTEATLTFQTRKGEAFIPVSFSLTAKSRNAIRAQINSLRIALKDGAMPLIKGVNPSITWIKG